MMCSDSLNSPLQPPLCFPPVLFKAFEIFAKSIASVTVKIHYTYGSSKLLQETEQRGAEAVGVPRSGILQRQLHGNKGSSEEPYLKLHANT